MTFLPKTSVILGKLIAFLFMTLIFGVDMLIIAKAPKILWGIYLGIGLTCLCAFIGTFFKKTREISWRVWIMSLLLYIAFGFEPTIKEQKDIEACLDDGNVWDDDERKCRTDCWRWTKENGCETE